MYMKKTNLVKKISGVTLAALAIFAATAGSASAGDRADQFARSWRKNNCK